MARPPVRTADDHRPRHYGRAVTTVPQQAPHPAPQQREAQERLWRALTRLDAIDQPGAAPVPHRDEIELELMVAWSEYQSTRST